MSWARLDDNLHDHPKVVGLSLPAIGLWTVCLTWAHRNASQCRQRGHVPAGAVRRFAGSHGAELARELVAAGMWEESEAGWLIHGYSDYPLTRPAMPYALRRFVYERDGNQCQACGDTKGGAFDDPSNLQVLCRRCNRDKWATHPDDWNVGVLS